MSLAALTSTLTTTTPPLPPSSALFTPTQTQLIAYTTPFTRPVDCSEYWEETILLSKSYRRNYETVSSVSITYVETTYTYALPIVYSNPAREAYTSCQPSEWADRVTSLRHDYHPAVCPSGWLAQDVSTAIKTVVEDGKTAFPNLSTAYCCKSGWSILTSLSMTDVNGGLCGMEYSQFLNGSYSVTTASTTLDVGDSSITLLSETTLYALHPPWRIAWDKKDTPTLTPQPPTLTNDMRIPKWTPGMNITFGEYDHNGQGRNESDGNSYASLYWFLVVGVPLIAAALIGCCCCCCFKHRNKEKRKVTEHWRRGENEGREGGGIILEGVGSEAGAGLGSGVRGESTSAGDEHVEQLPPYSRHDKPGPAYVANVEMEARTSGRHSQTQS